MIHGGLHLDFKNSTANAQECCLRTSLTPVDTTKNFWKSNNFLPLRQLNLADKWSEGCNNCRQLELSGQTSFRNGTNEGLGIYGQTNLSGPVRIDLMFDISCNLACRTCGTHSSTYWQKHLKEHGKWDQQVFTPKSKEEVINALSKLDLSKLRMLVFCGGETLLGQEYWDVAKWVIDQIPNAKEQFTLCFQTNGTQPVQIKNFEIIEKCFLVKLHISADGIGNQFEYLRWPASWPQVVNNLNNIRNTVPSNVMFLIEETISIFNLPYIDQTGEWCKQNFATNREGDLIDHTRHLARGMFGLHNLSQEYWEAMSKTKCKNLLPESFVERPDSIQEMLNTIDQFDALRDQKFSEFFPEVAGYYSRFR